MRPVLRFSFFAALLVAASLLPAIGRAQVVVVPADEMRVNFSRLSLAQVAIRQSLDYTIAFQNTAADTATSVTVVDTLDAAMLDLATLQVIGFSHNATYQINSTNILTVRFPGIQLPPSATDSLNSRGFLRFRVQPFPTLVTGDTIFNHAHVTLGLGATSTTSPTNQVTTIIGNPTGLATPAAATLITYPNPATEQLTVSASIPIAGTVQLELRDLLGRALQRHAVAAPAGFFHHPVELRAVPSGSYVLRLQLPDGRVSTRRIVKQ